MAFRFVHNKATENDFLPLMKQPGSTESRGAPQCSNLALSFFVSLKKARDRVADLVSRGIDTHVRTGGYVGKLELITSDGHLSKRPNKRGHLNLFQEEGVLFADRVTEYHNAIAPKNKEAEHVAS